MVHVIQCPPIINPDQNQSPLPNKQTNKDSCVLCINPEQWASSVQWCIWYEIYSNIMILINIKYISHQAHSQRSKPWAYLPYITRNRCTQRHSAGDLKTPPDQPTGYRFVRRNCFNASLQAKKWAMLVSPEMLVRIVPKSSPKKQSFHEKETPFVLEHTIYGHKNGLDLTPVPLLFMSQTGSALCWIVHLPDIGDNWLRRVITHL